MATQVEISSSCIAPLVSQRSQVLRRLSTAMQSHQVDLRLSVNHIETSIGCIAKSADSEVRQHLRESNLAISNLRECLSKLEIKWWMFENWHERHSHVRDHPESKIAHPKGLLRGE